MSRIIVTKSVNSEVDIVLCRIPMLYDLKPHWNWCFIIIIIKYDCITIVCNTLCPVLSEIYSSFTRFIFTSYIVEAKRRWFTPRDQRSETTDFKMSRYMYQWNDMSTQQCLWDKGIKGAWCQSIQQLHRGVGQSLHWPKKK